MNLLKRIHSIHFERVLGCEAWKVEWMVESGMHGMTETVLAQLERSHREGLPSQQIVELLETHGVPFSEATLRKYVQLGLLPRSVRVGRKGKHTGSQGLYPASIVRQVVQIKSLLADNYTIDEIRQECLLLRNDIDALGGQLEKLFDHVEQSLESRPSDMSAEHVRRDLTDARATAGDLIGKLETLESRLSMRARLTRAAGS